jgi:uncharacterized protein YcfL
MKKSIKEENTSKENIVSRMLPLQLHYNMLWYKLNGVIEQQVKENQQKKVNNKNN